MITAVKPFWLKSHWKKTGLTLRAHKAPANVDVFVVLAALAGSKVVWTEEAIVSQHQAACRHTVVIGVIGHGAANASSQPTYDEKTQEQRLINPHTSAPLNCSFGTTTLQHTELRVNGRKRATARALRGYKFTKIRSREANVLWRYNILNRFCAVILVPSILMTHEKISQRVLT